MNMWFVGWNFKPTTKHQVSWCKCLSPWARTGMHFLNISIIKGFIKTWDKTVLIKAAPWNCRPFQKIFLWIVKGIVNIPTNIDINTRNTDSQRYKWKWISNSKKAEKWRLFCSKSAMRTTIKIDFRL